MKILMDKIIRELVEESWEWARIGRDRDPMDKSRVFSETWLTSNLKVMRCDT